MSMIGNCRRVSRPQLAAMQGDPSTVPAFLYDAELPSDSHIDLDKSWHAIHFLLNGQTWEGEGPLFDAILGGKTLGEEDVGYGPARFLTPDEVRKTAEALNQVSVSELLAKFDAHQLNDRDIYPQHWTGDDIDYQYVRDNFVRLAEFFRLAAKNDDAMLLYIN
jgi:hypothetical protein